MSFGLYIQGFFTTIEYLYQKGNHRILNLLIIPEHHQVSHLTFQWIIAHRYRIRLVDSEIEPECLEKRVK